MTLKERITEDMKAAMRAKESDRLSAIRLLLAAIKQKEVDERITVDDAQVVALVDKLAKQRKDSITQFQAAGRTDLVTKEQFELEVLSAYLPQQAGADEVAAEIDAAVAQVAAGRAPTPADMGKVMALGKAKLAGRTDLVAKEQFELEVLSAYLPQQAGAAEVAAEIDAAVAQVAAGRAPAPADMGKVMTLVKAKLAGRADLSAVSGLVKARLSGGRP